MDRTIGNSGPTGLPDPAEIGGLSASEAEQSVEAGRVKAARKRETRSVGQIVRDNCLTLFNGVNLSLAVLIALFGDVRHTLFLGVALCSALIGIIQALRAKRMLERLSILRESRVEAVRGGAIIRVRPECVATDDILRLRAGDQVTADGFCTHTSGLLVNEALITGEADEVEKRPGDAVWSGSFVTAGAAYVRVTAVGEDSFAAHLSAEAKKEKKHRSRLVRTLGQIIKILTIALVPTGAVLFTVERVRGLSLEAAVTGTAAALVGMIPQGLILLTNVAFAVGVVNLGRRKTLVQSLSSIEALARVDILCLDKTGTITGGDMTVSRIIPLGGCGETAAADMLTRLCAVLPEENATIAALKKRFPLDAEAPASPLPIKVIPFTSSRKTSGAVFSGETLMLGAASHLPLQDTALCEQAEELACGGDRVLALARGGEDGLSMRGAALIVMEDTVRPEARDTFARFQSQGVALKVISGDSAAAAAGIARRAGVARAEDSLDCSGYAADGGDRGPMSEGKKKLTSKDAGKTVFGRVSPHQKRTLIRLMRASGHTVAMTGDGVNDVLALKEADCGVAMAGGSEAARTVADLVLLSSDFSAMLPAVNEGRRVINNIGKVAVLYLTKSMFSALLALIFIFLRGPYPFKPIQLTLIGVLTIGIPSFFLTLEPNHRPIRDNLIKTVAAEAVPTALAIVMHVLLARGLGVLLQCTQSEISTVCAFVTGALMLALVCRAAYPFQKGRGMLCAGVISAFLAAFAFFPGVFEFSGLFGTTGLAAAVLSASGIIFVWALRKLLGYFVKKSSRYRNI